MYLKQAKEERLRKGEQINERICKINNACVDLNGRVEKINTTVTNLDEDIAKVEEQSEVFTTSTPDDGHYWYMV